MIFWCCKWSTHRLGTHSTIIHYHHYHTHPLNEIKRQVAAEQRENRKLRRPLREVYVPHRRLPHQKYSTTKKHQTTQYIYISICIHQRSSPPLFGPPLSRVLPFTAPAAKPFFSLLIFCSFFNLFSCLFQ